MVFSGDRLKRMIFKAEEPPKARPAHVKSERRSGRRVTLPLVVRIKVNDGLAREVRIRDVNLPGLAIEPAEALSVGDRVNVGFNGYPDVAPAFALTGIVRRIVPNGTPGTESAAGIEIDKDSTSADALKNYRRLVLHYLHHRPLLDDLNKGYFEARCPTCEWIGRVGKRNPSCSRCGSAVEPV